MTLSNNTNHQMMQELAAPAENRNNHECNTAGPVRWRGSNVSASCSRCGAFVFALLCLLSLASVAECATTEVGDDWWGRLFYDPPTTEGREARQDAAWLWAAFTGTDRNPYHWLDWRYYQRLQQDSESLAARFLNAVTPTHSITEWWYGTIPKGFRNPTGIFRPSAHSFDHYEGWAGFSKRIIFELTYILSGYDACNTQPGANYKPHDDPRYGEIMECRGYEQFWLIPQEYHSPPWLWTLPLLALGAWALTLMDWETGVLRDQRLNRLYRTSNLSSCVVRGQLTEDEYVIHREELPIWMAPGPLTARGLRRLEKYHHELENAAARVEARERSYAEKAPERLFFEIRDYLERAFADHEHLRDFASASSRFLNDAPFMSRLDLSRLLDRQLETFLKDLPRDVADARDVVGEMRRTAQRAFVGLVLDHSAIPRPQGF